MVQPKEEYNVIQAYTIPKYKNDYKYKLDMNENTLGCSQLVLDAIKALSGDDFSKYPTYGEIEDKIASFLNISPDYIHVTDGGDAAINSMFQTYVDVDDEVLYAIPSYIMYKIDAQRVKAKIVQVPYEEKWVYPTNKIIEKINNKTKLIIICSPANPTGDVVPEEDICKILEAAPHAMILLDEAYYRFTNRQDLTFKHLAEKYSNISIMHTFSKDYGLAGIRLGYLITKPENIDSIHRSMDPFAVNLIACKAAEAALDDQKFVSEYVKQVHKAKEYVIKEMKDIAEEVYPSEANFVLFNVGPKQEWLNSKLLKNKIKVRRYPNNPTLDGFLRLTIGNMEQMKEVVKYFKDYQAIIFDIDGVLIDESTSYRKAIKCTFKAFSGKDISYDKIQEFKNQGGFNNDWKLTKYLLELENIEITMDQVIEKFQEFYFNNGKGFISEEKLLVKKDSIKNLAQKYKLSIFTGRPKLEAEFILKQNNLYEYFNPIITMDDLKENKRKPEPDGLNIICDDLKTRNVLYIGDMLDDILSAEKASIDFAGILPPQDKSEELKNLLISEGAIEVYDDINTAIYRIFGNIDRIGS